MARELGRAGTEVATVKFWDHIDRNPGCTVDELVKMAAEDMSIRIGARRAYARMLTQKALQYSLPAGRPAGREYHPRDVDPDKAIRAVVVKRLASMRENGSIRRDEDGRYFTARPVRRTGIGALVQHPDAVREDIARRNVLIAFRKYLAKHPDGKSFFPVGLFQALSIWADIERSEYLERRARDEAAG